MTHQDQTLHIPASILPDQGGRDWVSQLNNLSGSIKYHQDSTGPSNCSKWHVTCRYGSISYRTPIGYSKVKVAKQRAAFVVCHAWAIINSPGFAKKSLGTPTRWNVIVDGEEEDNTIQVVNNVTLNGTVTNSGSQKSRLKEILAIGKSKLESGSSKYYLIKEEFDFVFEQFLKHPNCEGKVQSLGGRDVDDIQFIYVSYNSGDSVSFFIQLHNGEVDDFSIHKLKDNTRRHRILDVRSAFREAVDEDIEIWQRETWRNHDYVIVCPLTGQELHAERCKEWDIDHEDPTFKELMNTWLEANGYSKENVPIESVSGVDGRFSKRLREDLRDSFRQHHSEYSSLRIVSKDGHVKLNQSNIQSLYDN